MKRIVKAVIFVLFVTLISCDNEDISLDGTLSGTISNYVTDDFDIIKTSYQSFSVGSKGKFTMTLSIPEINIIGSSGITGVSVSDQNALIGILDHEGFFYAYKGSSQVGHVMKTNLTTYNNNTDFSNTIFSVFMYCDRVCTIKGLNSDVSFTYDMKLKKGWNEVAFKYTDSKPESVSTTIPSDLKWRYFSSSSMSVKKYQLPKFAQ